MSTISGVGQTAFAGSLNPAATEQAEEAQSAALAALAANTQVQTEEAATSGSNPVDRNEIGTGNAEAAVAEDTETAAAESDETQAAEGAERTGTNAVSGADEDDDSNAGQGQAAAVNQGRNGQGGTVLDVVV